jgi:hypothetical protein
MGAGVMSDQFNVIMPKLASRLRMLSSSADMEVLSAARALLQVLANAGLDIHTLVERIQRGGGDEKLSAGEMQKIYDAAYAKGHADGAEQGRRSAVIAAAMPMGIIDTSNVGPGVNGYDWLQIAQHLAAHEHMFSGKTLDFVRDMPRKIAVYGCPTPKRADWLRDLFMQKFGGRID